MVIGQLLRQGPRICKSPESAVADIPCPHLFIPNLALGRLALGNLHKTTIFSDILSEGGQSLDHGQTFSMATAEQKCPTFWERNGPQKAQF